MKAMVLSCLIVFSLTFAYPADYINANDLSRDEAIKMIREVIKNEQQTDFTKYYQKYGFLYNIGAEDGIINKYKELEQEGYVRIKPLPENKSSTDLKTTYGIQFTDKASPYMTKPKEGSEDRAYISLAKVESVEIKELKKVSPKEYKAEVSLGYRLTPFGEILLGKGMNFQRSQDAFFEPHDNGWRVKFKVNF
jgi:hypothetical protein